MPEIAYLVARSYPDRIIGCDNRLPWHLKSDLMHFKRLTLGHAVIMGRKTYASIGRPLPKRLNIILSRSEIQEVPGLVWARNPESALLYADVHSISSMKRNIFVIGGEVIFEEFDRFVNKVWLTDVYTGPINGDAKFDKDLSSKDWWTFWENEFPKGDGDDFSFRISYYIRKKRIQRARLREEFLAHDPDILSWIRRYEDEVVDEIGDLALDLSESPLSGNQLDLGL